MPIGPFMQALISTGANVLGSLGGAAAQTSANKKAAALEYKRNISMMDYQNAYNTPSAQMKRYEDAGLNKHLIYNQGNPGNMESAPRAPQVQPGNYEAAFAQLGTQFQQSRLMAAQTDLTRVKADESGVKQDLMRAQKSLVEANPYLKAGYVDAMLTQLRSVADIKAMEKGFMYSHVREEGVQWQRGFLKMQRELDLLEQKFILGQKDNKIKAEIIQSKDYENALKKIQVDWMKDADLTPEHIRQGIMMLIQSWMR